MLLNSFIDWLRHKKRKLFQRFYIAHCALEWRKLSHFQEDIHGQGGLFVIPCDPWSLTGSRGDEAMLMVLQREFPNIPYYVVTATPEAAQEAKNHGWTPIHCWQENGLYENIYNAAKSIKPSFCFVLGADVMDGYYSPRCSVAFFALADIMQRHGVPTSLLGFSFNSHPNVKVLKNIKHLNADFHFHLRDQISLERFEKSTGKKAILTSDVAFLLQPDTSSEQYAKCAEWKRQTGKKLLIVNLHPMLIRRATQSQIAQIIAALHHSLETILKSTDWNVLLLPHDNRKNVTDNICLAPLYEKLKRNGNNRVKYIPEVLDAARMKGIVGLGDALVTSRMHLGIAGLSQGIPTMGFSYQDKFQGMIKHFDLDDQFILPIPSQDNTEIISQRLKWLLEHHIEVKEKLLKRLPKVLELAKRNFVFSPSPSQER